MLLFDPAKRINVGNALAHPYMDSLHCVEDEPSCEHTFNHRIASDCHTIDLKMMVFEDMCAFHPEALVELQNVRGQRQFHAAQMSNTRFHGLTPSADVATSSLNGTLPASGNPGTSPSTPAYSNTTSSTDKLPSAVPANTRTTSSHTASASAAVMPPINGAIGSGYPNGTNGTARPATSPRP